MRKIGGLVLFYCNFMIKKMEVYRAKNTSILNLDITNCDIQI